MIVKIAIARGRALAKVDNIDGAMVAVSGCDAAAVKDYVDTASSLADLDEEEFKKLYLAAFKSPTDIGVSEPHRDLGRRSYGSEAPCQHGRPFAVR